MPFNRSHCGPAAGRSAVAALALLAAGPALGGDGEDAVNAWLGALASGDIARVEQILAPEFQVVRSDGGAYAKGDYLVSGLPKISGTPRVSEIVTTRSGSVLVVRYVLDITETIGGAPVAGAAPRLTVFRRARGNGGEGWLVVAHANFASIPK
jgi:ketosteroid isomerase-like protein